MRRALAVALCLGAIGALAIFPSGGGPAAAQGGSDPGTDSAMTVSVTGGPFEGLEVNVSQTEDLVNQAVTVSWSGGTPMVQSGRYRGGYLQIMQCWGDEETGPERDQCQFGASNTASLAGNWTGSRQLSYGSTLIDPHEQYEPSGALVEGVDGVTYGTTPGQAYVQFRPVNGEVVTSLFENPWFDWQKTNEIPYGRTGANGSGEEIFEVQTDLEAPGLGCGAMVDLGEGLAPRRCWLVVVPRDLTEVDGTHASSRVRGLDSSPLSMGNWEHRLAFPLEFQPPSALCPIGNAERRMAGSELVAEAILSWQPLLCTTTGVTYGFSRLADENARAQLLSDHSTLGMVFTTRPVPPSTVPADRSVVYAPVALSGATIAFNIERQLPITSTDPSQGERIYDLNLSPRLVAKLLTQSYQTGSDRRLLHMADAPYGMRSDPEFLELNPSWSDWVNVPFGSAVVSLERADAAWEVWRWIWSDPDARAFLEGEPDPWDMTVNPYYLEAFELPRDDFPKNDQGCWPVEPPAPGERPQLCAIDAQPYVGSMEAGAQTTRRGDTLSRANWDNAATPPAYRPVGPQVPGKRLVLTVTDLASAARFGLQTASLRNAAGEMVAPSESSLLVGAGAQEPTDVPGVLQPSHTNQASGAYPLTMLTYAAAVNETLDDAARSDYVTFLRFAAEQGQIPGVKPGQLPPGYAPLSDDLRQQALAAADLLEQGPQPVTPAGTPESGDLGAWEIPDFSSLSDFSSTPFSSGLLSTSGPAAGLLAADALADHGAVVGSSPGSTPGEPLGPMRFLAMGVLASGVLAAVAGPVLRRMGRSTG